MSTKLDCKNIPVRVIALSDKKFDAARIQIREAAAEFEDVQRWPAIRGSHFFNESAHLLPNYREIAKQKYPYLQIPEEPVAMLSTQTESVLASGVRTNINDIQNPAAVGCALSHISIWQYMVANNVPASIVFEDDVKFEDRFVNGKSSFCNELDRILSAFALNFDVLNFNLATIPKPFVDATTVVPTRLSDVVQVKGIGFRAQGYLITLEGAKVMLTNVFPLLRVIDAHMTGLSVLPSTKQNVFYLATKSPWLKHELIDLNNSQIGYTAADVVTDSLFFVPRAFLLATIGFALLSFVAAIVFVVFAVVLKARLENSDKKAMKRVDHKEKMKRIKPY